MTDQKNEEIVKLDIDLINNNIISFTSHKICEMIVSNRYLKINSQIDVICMTELSNRRLNGDNFEFEKYIEEINKDLPVLNFNVNDITDIRSILNKIVK